MSDESDVDEWEGLNLRQILDTFSPGDIYNTYKILLESISWWQSVNIVIWVSCLCLLLILILVYYDMFHI
jgi:hypothetical protein